MNLGLAVKMGREAAGFKAKEFADKANLSASYLSLVETGKREPSISAVVDIAKALKIDVSDLFSIAEKIERPASKVEKLQNELSEMVTLALKFKHANK